MGSLEMGIWEGRMICVHRVASVFSAERRDMAAWCAVAVLLAASMLPGGCWLGEWQAPWVLSLDWQPERAWSQPWRWWTPVAVHYSWLHWGANLGGLILVACLGAAAGVPARWTVAWCVAWPLTHLGLLLRPELLHFGGLSGVLHAGVSLIALWLLVARRGLPRAVGAALALGLLGKVLHEAPWGPVIQYPAAWDIPVAPWSHATGVVSGILCGAVAHWTDRARRSLG